MSEHCKVACCFVEMKVVDEQEDNSSIIMSNFHGNRSLKLFAI